MRTQQPTTEYIENCNNARLSVAKKQKRKLTYTLIRPSEYEYNEELFIKEYSQFADLLLSCL